ncbi:MAG: ribosome-binding factor A [Patescibacteria group bacterium]|nr:ribosome-binding factor A [Patescibacteria group bacterium]MDD5490879.1 ribosome-binding factor A [Patescibacteria group bacterium]
MSLRQEKFNSFIQEELGRIINRDLEMPLGSLLTIVGADTAPDLKFVKVYVSVLPENYRGTVLAILRKNTKKLQQALNKKFRTKVFPKIQWAVDVTEEKAMAIEALLDKIKKEL